MGFVDGGKRGVGKPKRYGKPTIGKEESDQVRYFLDVPQLRSACLVLDVNWLQGADCIYLGVSGFGFSGSISENVN